MPGVKDQGDSSLHIRPSAAGCGVVLGSAVAYLTSLIGYSLPYVFGDREWGLPFPWHSASTGGGGLTIGPFRYVSLLNLGLDLLTWCTFAAIAVYAMLSIFAPSPKQIGPGKIGRGVPRVRVARIDKPLVFGTLALLILTVPLFAVTPTRSQSSDNQATSCESAVQATYKAMDRTNAIQNAIGSKEYSQGVTGPQNGTFESIFQIDRTITPYPTCVEEVQSFNVVFALYNRTGGWEAWFVISESPSLTVTGSTVQVTGKNVNWSHNWSGMQSEANSGATQPVYGASAYYTQEAPKYPNTGGCGNAGTCNFNDWAGLTDSNDASGGNMVQDGTTAFCTVTGGSSCSSVYYHVWYELLPASEIDCSGISVSSGQLMYAKSQSEVVNGGSNSLYDFYIYDSTTGQSCSSNGNSYSQMTSPKYGEFILENAKWSVNGGGEPLAAFNSVPYSWSMIYTAGSWSTIDHFYWEAIDMENGPGVAPFCGSSIINTDYGSGLGSNGVFTMNFDSNQYTPVYQTGC